MLAHHAYEALLVVSLLDATTTLSASAQQTGATQPWLPTRHILFVGDSFTHGRYLPVRTYNNIPGSGGAGTTEVSPFVKDENFDTTVPGRIEDHPGEYGPWGGIPGIVAELAQESGLPFDVHIEAISATTLAKNFSVAGNVIAQPLWDAVILQEASFEPIPASLTQNPNSDPQQFYEAVKTIESAVHGASLHASVYLYATWAPADTAYLDATINGASFTQTAYLRSLAELTRAYHQAYATAAAEDGHIKDIAFTGDAWALAWLEGVANPDPYAGSAPGVALSFGYQPGSEPSTLDIPTDAGYHHPSIYGAYLNGLVLLQTLTGTDVRRFGPNEKAAASLGIAPPVAVALQRIAASSCQHWPQR